jgi:hypothetical protein
MHNREKIWRSANGVPFAIKDMDLGHLVNVINWIADNEGRYNPSTLELMIAEAEYRQPELFSAGQAYPQKCGNRWEVIDPTTGQGHIVPPPAEFIDAVKDNEAYQRMSERVQKKRLANGEV